MIDHEAGQFGQPYLARQLMSRNGLMQRYSQAQTHCRAVFQRQASASVCRA